MPTAQAEAHSLARAREAGAVPFENAFAWTLDKAPLLCTARTVLPAPCALENACWYRVAVLERTHWHACTLRAHYRTAGLGAS
jgi:hypothetical protein